MPFFKHAFTFKCSIALKPTWQKNNLFILSIILPNFDTKKNKIFCCEFWHYCNKKNHNIYFLKGFCILLCPFWFPLFFFLLNQLVPIVSIKFLQESKLVFYIVFCWPSYVTCFPSRSLYYQSKMVLNSPHLMKSPLLLNVLHPFPNASYKQSSIILWY
jgi:hypothetical protein